MAAFGQYAELGLDTDNLKRLLAPHCLFDILFASCDALVRPRFVPIKVVWRFEVRPCERGQNPSRKRVPYLQFVLHI